MWKPAVARLPTPWTGDVTPGNALPEYPRPQLTREEWQNLNGVWEFAEATPEDSPPFGSTLAERILVPFPVESALSGILRRMPLMWYRREFDVSAEWLVGAGDRLLLHFGAVDYQAEVYVNGTHVASHTGGYGAFSADITGALSEPGPQELVVRVEDRTDSKSRQPIGKQRRRPDRKIMYEPCSGIWQTVWLEPVPDAHVTRLDMTPDLRSETLRLTVWTDGPDRGHGVEAVVLVDGTELGQATGHPDDELSLPVPDPRPWSPEDPFLYDVEVRLKDGERAVDTVRSYFGMREIGIADDASGTPRITLNGKPLFLLSTLDQGYWPDGIYTAPTDEALRFDLEQHKVLGFNTVRKHIKVEPDRWYYWADRLGLLVWQDMPSMSAFQGKPPPAAAQERFVEELREMVEQHRSWTSVIGWVVFNEGWGEWDRDATGQIADDVKAWDPTRLVVAHSGVNHPRFSRGDSGKGDVLDWHEYVGPAVPPVGDGRVAIDGEHGGFGLEVEGHMWFGEGHGYEMVSSRRALTRAYVRNQKRVLRAARDSGLSGAIYTQFTDVEHEVNGFFTYDRRVQKMDFTRVREINRAIIDAAAIAAGGR